MHNKFMGRTRRGFTESMPEVLVQTVTLAFDLATWFLLATHCLVMIIIGATLFSNPTKQSYGSDTNRFH